MTMLEDAQRTVGRPETPTPPPGGQPPPSKSGDAPNRRRRGLSAEAWELLGCLLASSATIWLIFTIAGLSAPFGFVVCTVMLFFTMYGLVTWRLHGVLHSKDRLGTAAIWTGSGMAFIALLAVVSYVAFKGFPVVIARFPHFITADMSGSGNSQSVTSYGAGAAIVGTLEQVAVATLISVPIGLLTATYLVESSSILSRVVRNVVDAMTGTPSIIAGLFIYLVWVAPHKTDGKNGVVAGVTLAIMMLPIVTRASIEVIRIVPGALREAALALGAPQWRVVLRIVMPAARVGLITAVILGIARTAGETAEVLFTAGGGPHYNLNPFHGNQDDLPLRIYEQVFQPSVSAIRVGWGVAFVLVVLVLALFTLARLVGSSGGGKRRRRIGRTRKGPA
jgi:phosphate transport system permease protein